MKRNLLCALIAIPAFSFGQTSILTENFDSYAANGTVAVESGGTWQTWGGTLPEDAFVSDLQSQSTANSMFVSQGNVADSYLHDMVLPFPAVYTSGRYELKMSYFVPVTMGAYFNLGSVWNAGGAGYEYGLDVFFNADGSGFVNASGTDVFQYSQNQWILISAMIDVDAGTYELFIDGSSVSTGSWGAAGGLGVIDIFGLGYTDGTGNTNGVGNFFVDDLELLNWTGVGIDENTLNPVFNVVPNPSNGNFTVNYEELDMASAEIQIVDVLGSVVYSSNSQLVGNGSIDFDLNLNTGVYFVSINDGATVLTERVIVKK